MFRFAIAALLIAVAHAPAAEPAEKQLVRPVLWWSDINRTSDGGSGGLKPKTRVIGEAKDFAAEWERLKMKGPAPKIEFRDHFVAVLVRADGLDFAESGGHMTRTKIDGGLKVDSKGAATAFGLPAFAETTNAVWYSTSLAIFPRKGIASVDGQKVPAFGEKRPALPDGKTIDGLTMSGGGFIDTAKLSIGRDGKIAYEHIPASELTLNRQPMAHSAAWEIPAEEAAALLDGLVADGLFDLPDDGAHLLHRTLTARSGQWTFTARVKAVPAKIDARLAPLVKKGIADAK